MIKEEVEWHVSWEWKDITGIWNIGEVVWEFISPKADPETKI